MAKGFITGVSTVTKNLNAEIKKIKFRSTAGVGEATLLVKKESQKLVPVVSGNLKNSGYTEITPTIQGPAGEIGFTAVYAKDVHENEIKEARRKERRGTPIPKGRLLFSRVGQWKFLETALKANVNKILEIIRNRTHVR